MEKLKYLILTEPDKDGIYNLSIQLTECGGGISLRRGDQAAWVIGQLRHLADLLELNIKK